MSPPTPRWKAPGYNSQAKLGNLPAGWEACCDADDCAQGLPQEGGAASWRLRRADTVPPRLAAAAASAVRLQTRLDANEAAVGVSFAKRFGKFAAPAKAAKTTAAASPAAVAEDAAGAADAAEPPLLPAMDALGRAAYAGKMVWWEDVGDLALHYEGLLRAMSRELAAERAMVAVLTGERMPDGTRGPPIGKYSRLAESSRRAARARARQYQLKIRYEAGGTISERTHMLADELEASVAPKQGHRFEHRLYTHDAITILDQKPGLRKSFEKLHCLRRKRDRKSVV